MLVSNPTSGRQLSRPVEKRSRFGKLSEDRAMDIIPASIWKNGNHLGRNTKDICQRNRETSTNDRCGQAEADFARTILDFR